MWKKQESTLRSDSTSTVCRLTIWGGDPSGGILRTWTVGVRMVGSVMPISHLNGWRRVEASSSILPRVYGLGEKSTIINEIVKVKSEGKAALLSPPSAGERAAFCQSYSYYDRSSCYNSPSHWRPAYTRKLKSTSRPIQLLYKTTSLG